MPKVNPALGGKLSPDIDEAARAIARRQRWKIVPEGCVGRKSAWPLDSSASQDHLPDRWPE